MWTYDIALCCTQLKPKIKFKKKISYYQNLWIIDITWNTHDAIHLSSG